MTLPGPCRCHVKPKLDDGEGTSEAVAWFSKIYPRTKQPDWPTAKPQDLIQRAGETVFVPNGWCARRRGPALALSG